MTESAACHDSPTAWPRATRRSASPRSVRGLSDRAIAWLFITPTIVLLLAINIFPLIWTIRLSFTNYRANRPNAPIKCVGLRNYVDILTDPDIWHSMQVTAHFVFWTIALQDADRLRARLADQPQLPRPRLLDHLILLPMMLSPAVVGNFWTFLLPAADRPLQLRRLVLHRHRRRPRSR